MNKSLLNRLLVTAIIILLSLSSIAVLNVTAQKEDSIWTTNLRKNLADFTLTSHRVITLNDAGELIFLRKSDGSLVLLKAKCMFFF